MGTLALWVTGFDQTKDEWTKEGTSPYLDAQDQPDNYVHSVTKKAEVGDFTFETLQGDITVNSVTLYIYGRCADAADVQDVFVHDGTDYNAYTISFPAAWGWANVAVPALDTLAKINAAKFYIAKENTEDLTDMDAAYLLVDFSGTITKTATDYTKARDAASTTKTVGERIQTMFDYAKTFESVKTGWMTSQEILEYNKTFDAVTKLWMTQLELATYIKTRDALQRSWITSVSVGDYAKTFESVKTGWMTSQEILEYNKTFDTITNLRMTQLELATYIKTRDALQRSWITSVGLTDYSINHDAVSTFRQLTKQILDYSEIYDGAATTQIFSNTITDYATAYDILIKMRNAFPTVVTKETSVEAANTSNHTVDLPLCQKGDLLIIFFACNADPIETTVSFPGGWNEIFEHHRMIVLAIAWRKADGTEGSSITVTTDDDAQSSHICYRISGQRDPTVQPPEVSTGVDDNSDNPDPDSLTPTSGAKDYLWFAVAAWLDDNDCTDYPANYTDGEFLKSSGAGDVAVVALARRELNAASEDPGEFTFAGGGDRWVACTVAAHPTTLLQTINDYTKIYDLLAGIASYVKTPEERATIYDVAYTTLAAYLRYISDYQRVFDEATRTLGAFTSEINEYITVRDVTQQLQIFGRHILDYTTVRDVVAFASVLARTINDYAKIYDVATASWHPIQTVLDYTRARDYNELLARFSRVITDYTRIMDDVTRLYSQPFLETLQLIVVKTL